MSTKIVHSFGIIPVRATLSGVEMLLIHMYGSAGGTHWTFPKGRPEAGESPVQSALRECQEEVGVVPQTIWEQTPLIESYTFTHNDVQIEKTVTYFIGLVTDGALTLQPEEIKEALWLPIQNVAEYLTHDSAKVVFEAACLQLQKNGLY